jgi:hypothetical protein
MTERYTREQHEQYRRGQDEKAREAEAERRERSAKDAARLKWVADGGTEPAFERQWPALRDEMRRRRVIDADERAREAHRAAGVSQI